jgi:hypothetical protein
MLVVNFMIVGSIPNERQTLKVLSIANGGEFTMTRYREWRIVNDTKSSMI